MGGPGQVISSTVGREPSTLLKVVTFTRIQKFIQLMLFGYLYLIPESLIGIAWHNIMVHLVSCDEAALKRL